MQVSQPIKKQFWVASYSSPAISVLTVTPVFMLSRLPASLHPWAVGLATLLVFMMWTFNIGVYAWVKKGKGRYLLSYVCCLVLIFLIFHSYSFHFQDQRFGSTGGGLHFHVVIFLAVNTVILILQDLVVSREKNAAMALENAQLRLRNAEALNLQLMQQVQPHFLFNSLSTLKSLIGFSPEQATEYLVRLSGFLRASLSSHGVSAVKVGQELDLCSDYLEMQQIRFGEALRSAIDVPANIRETLYLPVFSVQLLIENAIKHNVLTPERPLFIRVFYRDGKITVTNNLQKKLYSAEGAGTGLINLRERYKILTGHPVLVEATADDFSVSLNVFPYESSDH